MHSPGLTHRRLAIPLRTLAFTATALMGLTGCGFDAATDRPYTPAAGANSVEGDVDVLGAVVVSSAPGSGTFVASLANNDVAEPASFDTLDPSGGTELQAAELTPVEIPAGGLVDLAEEGGVNVTGEFEAGDSVTLALGFGSGEQTVIEVPVVEDDGVYSDLDVTPSPIPTDLATPEAPSETPSETPSESPGESPAASPSATETTTE